MESILARIKGERKLSFNSFRYRILHWSFFLHWPFAKAPKTPAESPLPNFLYTHYCPLFHLTNLLVFPGIFLTIPMHLAAFVGVSLWYIIAGIIAVLGMAWDGTTKRVKAYRAWRDKRFPSAVRDAKKRAKQAKKAERVAAVARAKEEAKANNEPFPVTPALLKAFRREMLDSALGDDSFGCFLYQAQNHFRDKFEPIFFNRSTKEVHEQWQQEWDDLRTRIMEQREIAKKKKEMLRDRIIWWSNFSRIFIKGILNCFYTALAVATVYYGVTWFIPNAIEVIVGMCVWIGKLFAAGSEVDFLGILKLLFRWTAMAVGVAVTIAAIVTTIVYCIDYVKWPFKKTKRIVTAVFDPFAQAVSVFFTWASHTFVNTADFISMFYETNCPPIKIVDESEERIAAEGEI